MSRAKAAAPVPDASSLPLEPDEAAFNATDAVEEGAGCGAAPMGEMVVDALAMLPGEVACTVAVAETAAVVAARPDGSVVATVGDALGPALGTALDTAVW